MRLLGLLWHLGGSQTDIATLCAENVVWSSRTIGYVRNKTGSEVAIRFGEGVAEIPRLRSSNGLLFPQIARWRESDRAKAFLRRCRLVGVSGISLHSYRYAWAERAATGGYPERYAQLALGHRSRSVHAAYARNARVELPALEDYEAPRPVNNVIPLPIPPPPAPRSDPHDGVAVKVTGNQTKTATLSED